MKFTLTSFCYIKQSRLFAPHFWLHLTNLKNTRKQLLHYTISLIYTNKFVSTTFLDIFSPLLRLNLFTITHIIQIIVFVVDVMNISGLELRSSDLFFLTEFKSVYMALRVISYFLPFSHRWNITILSLLDSYFHGKWSDEQHSLVPPFLICHG